MGLSHLISIVGAGPGDPELLTVKAHKRITDADVVLYDALMGKEMLSLAKPDAALIYVGKLYKDGQDQTERQNEIHSQFLKFSKENKKVVRLKAGDPMIFGRGAEEIRFCKTKQLNYEVIPGITAGIAASCHFNIPLTERGKNSAVLFYTGHRENGSFSDLHSVVQLLKESSPVVIYMGLNNLPDLATALLKEQVDPTISVQICSQISKANQKSYSTSLREISSFLKNENPETPSIIIIGKHAEII